MLVVSDFISQPGWEHALARLAQRHEVVAVRLFDPLEMDLPELGLVTVEDAETGEQLFIDTADPAFRQRYAAEAEARETALREALAHAGADTLELSTDDDLLDALTAFRRPAAPARPAQDRQPLSGPPARPDSANGRGSRDMSFIWPNMLWALLLLPLLVVAYLWLLRRRRRSTVRLASVAVAKAALGKGPGWRRHVPPLLLLLAIGTLLAAMARPLAVITLPLSQRTIILAMDVSGSMRATDVQPSRIVAAQEAAKAFVSGLPREVRVGVVAFAGTAAVVQAPTVSREDVIAAIDRFQLQRATATGSGIILSLATIFPDAGIEISQATGQKTMPGPLDEKKDKKEFTPVEPGSYTSAAIIMLTDGARTTGPDPLEAAKMAADRGVRVYTVGIGTVAGETIGFEGWSMRVRLDEAALKQVALLTQAEYFYAGTAQDLMKVYQSLSSRLVVEKKETEITAFFAAAGALLALLGAGLSVWWFGRVA